MNKGKDAQFTCSATGVGSSDFIYQWFLNREPIDGQTTAFLSIDSVSVYETGDYTCSVKSPYGIGQSENKGTLFLNGNLTFF